LGPRQDKNCANIVTCNGSPLTWVNDLPLYLGIYIVRYTPSDRFIVQLTEYSEKSTE